MCERSDEELSNVQVDISKAWPRTHVLSGSFTFLCAFFIYSFLSPYSTFCSLALFHVLTSVLISSPLTAVVLLSVSQSGLSEYVHALSEPFSSLCYFGHLDFD